MKPHWLRLNSRRKVSLRWEKLIAEGVSALGEILQDELLQGNVVKLAAAVDILGMVVPTFLWTK
jgi:hypothetical protein